VSEFLLLGNRPPVAGEISPACAARDLVALADWHRWLRRWGLLRAFALPRDPGSGLRACLVVRASGDGAAHRVAEGWGRLSGYQVTVLPLSGPDEDGGRERGS
jgi:hypothetical protein